jgi:hypothetical protein
MWNETEIEKLLIKKIDEQSSQVLHGESYKTYYNQVKDYFIQKVYPNIIAIEPNLTDHGVVHIQNVLQNAFDIINGSDKELSGIELYVLCMSILVHDIGNLSGREGHESKLKEYFNIKIFLNIDRSHIMLISQIAKSHGGEDCDTIGKLQVTTLDSKEVRSQKIAAILRFADELAEGKQRTSSVMLEKGFYAEFSKIYHIYASILDSPTITKDTIILKYNIFLDEHLKILKNLLAFIHKRVKKLYKELQYCGHYCEDVNKIKKVAITISIFKDKEEFEPLNIENCILNFELSGQSVHCSKKSNFEENYNTLIDELEKEKTNTIITEAQEVEEKGLLSTLKSLLWSKL